VIHDNKRLDPIEKAVIFLMTTAFITYAAIIIAAYQESKGKAF
jgi:cell division protein FtsL